MRQTVRRLPDAELEVMQAVWQCDTPVSRVQIEELLKENHPMAVTTLLTLLTRLAEKGFLSIEKDGRRSIYMPKVTREEYLAQQSRSFVEKVCGGSMSAFAAALCDSGLSKDDLAQLRELLERDGL